MLDKDGTPIHGTAIDELVELIIQIVMKKDPIYDRLAGTAVVGV
jgi:hypothetical protein